MFTFFLSLQRSRLEQSTLKTGTRRTVSWSPGCKPVRLRAFLPKYPGARAHASALSPVKKGCLLYEKFTPENIAFTHYLPVIFVD